MAIPVHVDPYQTLGLPRGAPLADVKRAYRRLAKQHHPDSAGPAAARRFIAIGAAYEAIVRASGRGPGSGSSAGPGSDWYKAAREAAREADRERARRGRRAGAGSGQDTRGRPGPGAGQAGRRKATPGSTTYDDADERDPAWYGAAWYGPASGTYWTVNPREYADPRKHGPEYQARAARAAGEAGVGGPRAGGVASAPSAGGPWAGGVASAPSGGGTRARGSTPAPTGSEASMADPGIRRRVGATIAALARRWRVTRVR